MSPPDTNLKKQERRHIGPLIGFGVVLVFVTIIGVVFLGGGGDEVTGTPEDAGGVVTEGEAAGN